MLPFFAKKPFGLDISDHSIEALSLKIRGGKINLSAYNRINIPPGVIENGIIYEPEKLALHLKKINVKNVTGSFGTNQCLITFPQSQTYTHLMSLQRGMSPVQIKHFINEEIQQFFPISLEEVVYNYIKVGIDKDKKTDKIFVAAAPKDILDSYVDVLKRAGLSLLAVDLEVLSQSRTLLRNQKLKAGEAVMIIDSGYTSTNFSFFQDTGVQYISEAKIGGHIIAKLMMDKLSLTAGEVEEEKKIRGIARAARFPELQETLTKFAQEILEALHYYQKRSGCTVKKIILTGGNSLILGIPEYFSTVLEISTKLGNPFFGIAKEQKIVNNDAVLYTNVVGLALRGLYWGQLEEENSINLLQYL